MAGLAPIRLTSPRGRFVQGDAFEPQTTDQQGAPLTIKTGPNAGQPTQRWFMAVAFSKTHPETLPYLLQIGGFARSAWPAYFPTPNNTPPLFGCSHPRFSIKIMDGDGVDDNGKPNRDKPGFAGCWVVKYSTSIKAPGVWQEPNYDEMARVTDARLLPRGYFVKINHTIQSNENDQRPGLYVNLDKVAICADQAGAEVIQSGPTAAEAFGAGAVNAAPTPPPAPGAPAVPAGIIANPGVDLAAYRANGWTDDLLVQHGHATRPAAAPTPPPVPAAPPAPPAPPVPASPPPPPYSGYIPDAPPARVMLAAAQGAKYEDLIKAGWTDDLLVRHGMMAP